MSQRLRTKTPTLLTQLLLNLQHLTKITLRTKLVNLPDQILQRSLNPTQIPREHFSLVNLLPQLSPSRANAVHNPIHRASPLQIRALSLEKSGEPLRSLGNPVQGAAEGTLIEKIES